MEMTTVRRDELPTYVFGPFRFDTRELSLTGSTGHVRLTRKSTELLVVLIRSAGHLVTKDELIQQLWPETHVGEGSLTFHIHRLRQALGDVSGSPTYIETVQGRGYRFMPAVTVATDEVPVIEAAARADAVVHDAASPSRSRPWLWGLLLVAVLSVVSLGVAGVIHSPQRPQLRVARTTRLTHDGNTKSELFVLGDSTLLLSDARGRYYELAVATGALARKNVLDAYQLLDVSPLRGEALAFRRFDPGADRAVWVVRLDGTAARRLGMVARVALAVWSRDGRRVAYTDEHSVYVTDSEGGVMRTVSSFTGMVGGVAWGPADRSVRVTVVQAQDRAVR